MKYLVLHSIFSLLVCDFMWRIYTLTGHYMGTPVQLLGNTNIYILYIHTHTLVWKAPLQEMISLIESYQAKYLQKLYFTI